jgi:hypothetical protein
MLTRIDFASLNYVGGTFKIKLNPALTFASVPSLSQVGDEFEFCENNPAFLYPQGLRSISYGDGFSYRCVLKNGAGSCGDIFGSENVRRPVVWPLTTSRKSTSGAKVF